LNCLNASNAPGLTLPYKLLLKDHLSTSLVFVSCNGFFFRTITFSKEQLGQEQKFKKKKDFREISLNFLKTSPVHFWGA